MVTQMGFSNRLGDVDLDSHYSRLSSETKQSIENEVRRIVNEARQRVHNLLLSKRRELDLIATALVEYEVLDREEMQKVLKGEKLPKLTSSPNAPIKLPELKIPPGLGGSEVPSRQSPEGEGGTTDKGDDVRI